MHTHNLIGKPIVSIGEDSRAEPMAGLAFSGRTLMSVSDTYAIRLWKNILWHNFAELQTEVCRLVGSGLNKTEGARDATGVPATNAAREQHPTARGESSTALLLTPVREQRRRRRDGCGRSTSRSET